MPTITANIQQLYTLLTGSSTYSGAEWDNFKKNSIFNADIILSIINVNILATNFIDISDDYEIYNPYTGQIVNINGHQIFNDISFFKSPNNLTSPDNLTLNIDQYKAIFCIQGAMYSTTIFKNLILNSLNNTLNSSNGFGPNSQFSIYFTNSISKLIFNIKQSDNILDLSVSNPEENPLNAVGYVYAIFAEGGIFIASSKQDQIWNPEDATLSNDANNIDALNIVLEKEEKKIIRNFGPKDKICFFAKMHGKVYQISYANVEISTDGSKDPNGMTIVYVSFGEFGMIEFHLPSNFDYDASYQMMRDLLMGNGNQGPTNGTQNRDILFDSLYTTLNIGDVEIGGKDNDTLTGSNQIDYLYGQVGNDTLIGNAENDVLDGGSGNDVLDGGDGNDELYGGNGNDVLDGGNGNDVYIFKYEDTLNRGRTDTIENMTNDIILIKDIDEAYNVSLSCTAVLSFSKAIIGYNITFDNKLSNSDIIFVKNNSTLNGKKTYDESVEITSKMGQDDALIIKAYYTSENGIKTVYELKNDHNIFTANNDTPSQVYLEIDAQNTNYTTIQGVTNTSKNAVNIKMGENTKAFLGYITLAQIAGSGSYVSTIYYFNNTSTINFVLGNGVDALDADKISYLERDLDNDGSADDILMVYEIDVFDDNYIDNRMEYTDIVLGRFINTAQADIDSGHIYFWSYDTWMDYY